MTIKGLTNIPQHSTLTIKEIMWIVLHFDDGFFLSDERLEGRLQSLPPVLGVNIELGQVSGLSGPPVSMCESSEALESFGHNAGKPLLSRQSRDEENVLGRAHLVGAMRTT